MTAPGVTPKMTRKFGGMPNYAFLTPYWSRIDDKPFLSRFILFRTPLCSIDITRIHMADNQREWPHDHSRNFWSFKLLGDYEEDVYIDPHDLRERFHKKHGWLSVHKMSRYHAHSITKISPMLVTVLFLGRQKQKSNSGTPDGKVSIGFKVDQDEWS
jgi:hypothetical protein